MHVNLDPERKQPVLLACGILCDHRKVLLQGDAGDCEGGEEEACLYGTECYEVEDEIVGILIGETGGGAA